jgi:hypothetical protein
MSYRLLVLLALPALVAADPAAPPRFRMQEIDTSLKVGYAVLVADVNGDGKPDLVVVDTQRVVWYENPTWKRRTIIEGKTRPDNVCIAAADIDGDGKVDFALGAAWNPSNTKSGGTLQWLRRGPTLDDPWELFPIGEEPTVHRIRFADLDGTGRPQLIVTPLMGRDSTRPANWMDGRPVRILKYPIPADPVKGPWVPDVIDESLHVVHNFTPIPTGRKGFDLLTASYEGVTRLTREGGQWKATRLGAGNQADPKGNRGSSEIKLGRAAGKDFMATVEPWHGYQVVVYSPPAGADGLWTRHVLDEHLRWGHAVWAADLDGDGDDELIIGVRDEPAKGDSFTDRRGVRIYKSAHGDWTKATRTLIDPGGVAVEDLAAADLNGNGKIDLIAVGRQTGNVRIYWNEGK